MRLLFMTAGSRGDVEPFAALARAAQAAGHPTRLIAPVNSGAELGDVDVALLDADWSRLVQDQGVSAAAALRAYRTAIRPAMRSVIVGGAEAALRFGPDVIVYHPKMLSAPLVADALGVPHVLAELVPAVTPTRAFPAVGTSTRGLGALNRLTYAGAGAARLMFRHDLEQVGRSLGIPAGPSSPPTATLIPISSAILERPSDWPDTVQQTGPWLRPASPAPLDPRVAAFIAGGPFITAGFGSMHLDGAEDRGRAVVEAARANRLRCLLVSGLGGLALPADLQGSDVLVVDSVPHDLVLPTAYAAVHHGGIGTIQTATAAGTPSVLVPFMGDQPFWGARLHQRGLAPAAIPARRLTSTAVAEALSHIEQYRPAVLTAAGLMRTEDGVTAALTVLEQLASRGRS